MLKKLLSLSICSSLILSTPISYANSEIAHKKDIFKDRYFLDISDIYNSLKESPDISYIEKENDIITYKTSENEEGLIEKKFISMDKVLFNFTENCRNDNLLIDIENNNIYVNGFLLKFDNSFKNISQKDNIGINANNWKKMGNTRYTSVRAEKAIRSIVPKVLYSAVLAVLHPGIGFTYSVCQTIIDTYKNINSNSKDLYVAISMYRDTNNYYTYKEVFSYYSDSSYRNFITSTSKIRLEANR